MVAGLLTMALEHPFVTRRVRCFLPAVLNCTPHISLPGISGLQVRLPYVDLSQTERTRSPDSDAGFQRAWYDDRSRESDDAYPHRKRRLSSKVAPVRATALQGVAVQPAASVSMPYTVIGVRH